MKLKKSIKAVYIPIGGSPSATQIYQLRKMMEDTKGPVLGYRSFGYGTSVKHQDDAMFPLLRISADYGFLSQLSLVRDYLLTNVFCNL